MAFPRRYYPDYPPPRPAYASSGDDYSPFGAYFSPRRSALGPIYPSAARPVYLPQPVAPVVTAETVPAASEAVVISETKAGGDNYVVNKKYKYWGYALLFLSVATIALESANIGYTVSQFNVTNSAVINKPFNLPYILTWIAPGIWASIPVFITGYLAIRVAGKYNAQIRIFALFTSLSAFVFTPAIIGISVAEIFLYHRDAVTKPIYMGQVCYSLDKSESLSCPKFVLPLVVAILGSIEFYLTLMVTMIFCCCWKPMQNSTRAGGITTLNGANSVEDYYPANSMFPSSYPPQVSRFSESPYVASRQVIEPDMNFLRSYPAYRPAASRGFGFAPAYNRQSYYGNFPGTLPSLTGFGPSQPNPAYRTVYA